MTSSQTHTIMCHLPSSRYNFFLLSALFWLGATSSSHLQAQNEGSELKLSKTKPTGYVFNHGWSEKGYLVIGISLYGPTEKTIQLGRDGAPDPKDGSTFSVFTTKSSSLEEPKSKKRFRALRKTPGTPNFGFIKTAGKLSPGKVERLTGAYSYQAPKPVPGQPIPEELDLVLHLPGGFDPVEFSIPNPYASEESSEGQAP